MSQKPAKIELALTVVGIVALGGSVNFLIFTTAGVMRPDLYVQYVLVPSLILLLVVAAYSYASAKRLWNRLITGLWAGAIATIGLEAFRLAFVAIRWLPGDD